MPKVSEFYGIQIMFYLNDHGVPHFHARYAGKRASIAIESLEVWKVPFRRVRPAWSLNGPWHIVQSCWSAGTKCGLVACQRRFRRLNKVWICKL